MYIYIWWSCRTIWAILNQIGFNEVGSEDNISHIHAVRKRLFIHKSITFLYIIYCSTHHFKYSNKKETTFSKQDELRSFVSARYYSFFLFTFLMGNIVSVFFFWKPNIFLFVNLLSKSFNYLLLLFLILIKERLYLFDNI